MKANQTRRKKKESKDRISGLCDPLLHHIMSFMDMKDVLKTMRLSKRWRSLWTSVPVLNFKFGGCFLTFVRLVDRVLHGHCKDSNLQRLSISYTDYWTKHLDYWISIAVQRHTQEICIENREEEDEDVDEDEEDLGKQDIPNFIFTSYAHCLRSLELHRCNILGNKTTREVVISCHFLENLKLRMCKYFETYILQISAPQLKSLFIQQKLLSNDCRKKLKIFTPELESLVLKGTPFRKYVLTNVGSLVNVDVQFDDPIQAQTVIKLLKGLYNTETQKLSCQLQQSTEKANWRLPSFMDLRWLKFNLSDCSRIDCTIHNLLINCYRLETLSIGINQITNGEKDFMELSQCISSLKYVEFQGVQGREHEMDFFEFFLKTASALEAFVVSTSDTFLRNTFEEKATFQMKIYTLPRVSSRVKILFQSIVNNNDN